MANVWQQDPPQPPYSADGLWRADRDRAAAAVAAVPVDVDDAEGHVPRPALVAASMSDLAAFLLARIAEDEAVARAAVGRTIAHDDGSLVNLDTWEEQDWIEIGGEQVAHVDRWHPARVLAECAAKRRIVEHCRAPMVYIGTGGPPTERDFVPGDGDPSDALVLRLLALPYAEHPDYRAEWKP